MRDEWAGYSDGPNLGYSEYAYGFLTQQKHPAPEEEHMSVTLALPADAQTGVSAVAFLALIACAFSYILQTTLLET